MKKTFKIYIFFLAIMFFIQSDSHTKEYKINDILKNNLIINKNFQILLPPGEWILAEKEREYFYGLTSKIFTLVKLEGKKIIESIEVLAIKKAGIYEGLVNQAIYEALFKNKYDGCYERPEYSIVRFYLKGNTHNCFLVYHSDMYKDLFTPDDPELKSSNSQLKKWIKENNIELPKVALFSNHSYFSRFSAGKWYMLSYAVDPETLGAPKNKFIDESGSEYHRNNIGNYPKFKDIMTNWISLSAQRHKNFENSIGVKTNHILELDDLSPFMIDYNNYTHDEIVIKIKQLNELYKSGVLTKEEFDKAKNIILN